MPDAHSGNPQQERITARRAFRPKAVRQMHIDDFDSRTILNNHSQGSQAVPLHITGDRRKGNILETLVANPASSQTLVELEVGEYDKPGFERIQLPLKYYLEWLRDGTEQGKMQGKQVYLAQSRLEISTLKANLGPPAPLQEMLDADTADLYQASWFIGASGATTPLHYDPYINVFRLAGSSGPDAAKHFLIFPPSMSSHLKRGGDASSLRNTSPVQFDVHNAESDSPAVHFKPDSPSQGSFEQLADAAYAVTLRAGELLMIPERWWHRVENIGPSNGWTAGVGYWFLMRK